MNKLIVKPMPPSHATPTIAGQVAPAGRSPMPRRSASHEKPTMPMGLPMNRPSAMPSGIDSVKLPSVNPDRETPALAKANTGRIM